MSEHEDVFILHAKDNKVFVKMSQIDMAFKTGLALLMSYFDLITNVFVLRSYWMAEGRGLHTWGVLY